MQDLSARKILVVGPAWIGDMVMSQSLFMALKHRYRNCAIDVVAPAWSSPVLARMPEVRRIIEVDIAHGELQLATRMRVGRSLRGQYDQAIVLPRSYKSALVPYFARIPKRTAYRGEMRYGIVNDMRHSGKRAVDKAVQQYVSLSESPARPVEFQDVHFPKLRVDENKRDQAASRLFVSEATPSVALMPGAEFGPSKRWPARYFGELASMFRRDGFAVYIFGSSKDHAIGEEVIASSGGGAVNLCGKTSLEEAIDLISLTKIAVTNDSGLMHVAAAVGCSVVAIYGSITPNYTPPLTEAAQIEYLNLECSPCWQKECPYGHYNCLHNLMVGSVYQSANELLGRVSP